MSVLDQKYVQGVYIPAALLLVGTAIMKREWLPFAAVLAAVLGGWKVFRNMPRKVLKPNEFQDFELKEKTILSHNTAIYRFKLPRSTDVLGLPIGQHISVGATIDGKDVMRSYTPISADEDTRGHFDLLIKSYPTGNISKHVASLMVGQTLRVRGPKGAMVYTPNMAARIGMIAGGTGITPMLQIVRAVVRGRPRNGGADTTRVDLVFANVKEADILLREDLDALAREDDGFAVHHVLNEPPAGWTGGTGFVTEEVIREKLPLPGPGVKLLVCGPPPMVSAMKKAVVAVGFPKPGPVSKLHDQVFCF